MPDFFGTIEQPNGVLPLRDITPEDLLGRQLCDVDEAACQDIVAGGVVMVTGAAGSIGSELCRQILALKPRTLLMLDNNETGLHDLFISLRCPDGCHAVPIVADVTRRIRPHNAGGPASERGCPMASRHKPPSKTGKANGTVTG